MSYIKNGLKVLFGYLISLVIFAVFLYVVLSIAKENLYKWLPVYSFVIFLLMFAIIYSDIKRLAAKEKRPQYNLNPYPLKGLIYGLLGFSPLIFLELIYPLIVFEDSTLMRIKEIILNTLLGPLYWLLKITGETAAGYAAVSAVVPAISMLAYLAGYYGFELGKYIKKKPEQEEKTRKFEKSPWNPTLKEKEKKQPKRKKKTNGSLNS